MSGAAEGRRSAPRVKLRWTASDIENMQAKYVKILSHRIPILTDTCDVVLYMDSKIFYTHATVSEIFSYEHPCITLFEHPWRTFHGAYTQEIADSYNQARYAATRPARSAAL